MSSSTSRKARLIVILLSLIAVVSANAATFHVDIWGDDVASPACGKKTNPCRTIQQAINQASPRSKVKVGPGTYEENLTIGFDGTKLESIAGRFGTFIDTGSGDHGIIINANKVQIGKRARGFSIRGDQEINDGIFMSGRSGVRIEGNRITQFNHAVRVSGVGNRVLHNRIDHNGGHGIFSLACEKCVIQDNWVANSGSSGLFMNNTDNSSIIRNVFHANSIHGINGNNTSSGNRIKDNVLLRNLISGVDLDASLGTRVQANIAALNLNDGFDIIQFNSGVGPRIDGNLAVGNGDNVNDHGFELDEIQQVRFESNSAVQSGDTGIRISLSGGAREPMFNRFSRNNSYASGSGIGISNDSGLDFGGYTKHFFGGPDKESPIDPGTPVDSVEVGINGMPATKPNAFKATRAAGL